VLSDQEVATVAKVTPETHMANVSKESSKEE